METVSILYDTPRMSLRAHKELVERAINDEGPHGNGVQRKAKDMIPHFSIEALGWK